MVATESKGSQAAQQPNPGSAEKKNNDTPEVPKKNSEEKPSKTIDEKRAEENISNDEVVREPKEASYVGWRQIGGWQESDTLTAEDDLIDLSKETFLDNVLPDSAYGDWYHSLGIIFASGFLSFLVGYFKFSMASVFFVAIAASLYYRTSAKKYRSAIRDQVQRELTVQKIENDYESMEWTNNFLDKYWPLLEPGVSQMVVQNINPLLAATPYIPAFVKSIWIDQFTLGVKPPRIEHVKTFQNTKSDIVVMDWEISLTPHDLSDMNAKQMRNYVNQRLVVKAVIFGVRIPIYLSDFAMRAKTRIRFKLMTPYPHIDILNIQLLEIPEIDFAARPFGDYIFNGEVMDIPMFWPAIKQLIKVYVGPMLLPPFSMQLNIPQLLSGVYGAIGVLKITIKNAEDIKRSDGFITKTFNPYVTFGLSGEIVARTKAAKDTLNPVWNETKYILLASFTEPLTITAVNERENLKDKAVGRVEYNLSSLHDHHNQKNLSCNFLRNFKPAGTFNFDLHFFPTVSPKRMPDGTVEEPPDFNTGIARITIEEAKGLGKENEDVSAFVELYFNSKLIFTTPSASGDKLVQWNQEHENVITDRRKSRYKIVVKNSKGNVIGSIVQSLSDLVDRTQTGKKEIALNESNGQIKIGAIWKPVGLDIGTSAIAYTPPIGVLRVFLNKAEDLKNLETVGKIDPYAKVLLNDNMKERTEAKSSTLNPIWNHAIYVAVTSPNQKLTIEVMDVETVGADRPVGKCDIKVDDMFHKGEDDRYTEFVDDKPRTARLVTRKGMKGAVTYYLAFYPCLPILTLDEMQEIDEARKKGEELQRRQEEAKSKPISDEEKKTLDEELTRVADVKSVYVNKMKLDLDELLQYNAGVFSVTVLDGEMSQIGVYVQAFFDSGGQPRFVSPKIPTRTVQTGWNGDVMIKELEYSITTFRVTKNRDSNKAEPCICEVKIPTIELVKNCYYKPSILTLSGEGSAKIMLQVSWFPVAVTKLPQADLISNSGDLTITAKNAESLISADRNGLSDPFLKFYINDDKTPVYKTRHVNKTLNPTWNESGTIEIHNRVNDYLRIKVMDWDAANSDDLIGRVVVPLSKVDPENPVDMDLPIVAEDGGDGGMLHLSFSFAPRYTNNAHKPEKKVGDIASKGLTSGFKAGTTVVTAGFDTIGKIGKTMFGGKKNHYVAQGIYNSAL
ncbi:TCB2 (YNL087W) and TCB1 (YOR086C) [Zygosaccharomyces parabailii]|nr:TCB2 (YNL087W) and TCB1 (YOR086C) [Zygosaccharomyces parabailii]CDH08571.1 probable Tricalbin-1 [Zygosaccharomyces bailii ISA1307]